MEINKKYPLIDLEVSEQPPFWVYNNYAYVYYNYLESLKKDPQYFIMGDYQDKPKLDELLQIKLSNNPNFKGIYFIENESFEWVEQVYYPQLVQSEPSYDWIFSDYAINCFSANYDILTPEYKVKSPYEFDTDEILLPPLGEIYKIEIYNFENAGLFPNSKELDLLVIDYLKEIVPDWGIQYSNKDSIIMDKNRVYHFFEYHFKSYKGNCYDFINHCDKIINEVWEVESPQNLKKQKYFNDWKTEKLVEYGLDRSKLNLEQKNKIETPISNLISAEFNYRMVEDIGRTMNKAMSVFKLPYGFLKYDMNEILTFFEIFFKSNFFIPSQILLFNREIKKRNYFKDKDSWLRDGNSNQYYTRDYILRLFGSHEEQIAVSKEQQEGDYDNSFVNYVNNIVSIIIKREFKLVVKPENLDDNFLDNLLSNKIKIKTETFFLELDKLGLEPVTTPEPPQEQDNEIKFSLTLSTRHGAKTAIYYAFKQLIDKNIISNTPTEVALFFKQNIKGFENCDVKNEATEIGRNRNRELKNGTTEPKKNNQIDLEDF